jgi:hypothetical protein
MSRSTLPRHHFTGLRAVGLRKDGRPIYPVMGGSEPPEGEGQKDDSQKDQNSGPEMAKDDQGNDLGYPVNTAVVEMTDKQQAAYWRTESKKQQRLREAAERQKSGESGTVRDQQQTQSAKPDDKAVQAQIDEARREGQRDAVVVSLTTSLQMREKTPEEITELLDVVNPDKFLNENGKVDSTKVANYIARVAPVKSGGGGGGGAPGQGRFEQQTKTDPREIAREEAKRRGLVDSAPNRGALGGLRK